MYARELPARPNLEQYKKQAKDLLKASKAGAPVALARMRKLLPSSARLTLAGAEADAVADMYGGGCTTLGLVATSIHPKVAGVLHELIDVLLAQGARMDAPMPQSISPAGARPLISRVPRGWDGSIWSSPFSIPTAA